MSTNNYSWGSGMGQYQQQQIEYEYNVALKQWDQYQSQNLLQQALGYGAGGIQQAQKQKRECLLYYTDRDFNRDIFLIDSVWYTRKMLEEKFSEYNLKLMPKNADADAKAYQRIMGTSEPVPTALGLGKLPPKKSNMQWLDDRVNEVRVRL